MAQATQATTEATTNERSPKLGIAAKDIDAISTGLAQAVAETFTLFVKTQGYHWNVTGPTFHSLHEMFEEQYLDLHQAADDLAERMRALGTPAPGSFTEFLALATIKDSEPTPDATTMVKRLASDHESISRILRPLVDLADQAGDVATADLLTARLGVHEKFAWMLRATAA
jgi:starvation-inducible DNA-binding protein